MRDRSTLVTLDDVSAYVHEVIAEAESGRTSYRRAASRIVGLGALDAYYDSWTPRCPELRELHSVAGMTEVAAVATDLWPELRETAKRLHTAIGRQPGV